jgi:hypothetical protein
VQVGSAWQPNRFLEIMRARCTIHAIQIVDTDKMDAVRIYIDGEEMDMVDRRVGLVKWNREGVSPASSWVMVVEWQQEEQQQHVAW